jgi:hypothetical protein
MIRAHQLSDVVDAGLAPSVRWLQERLRRGDIPGIRVPRPVNRGCRFEWRMTDADVEALVASLRNQPVRQLTALTSTSLRRSRKAS